jgi:hypothetical protein
MEKDIDFMAYVDETTPRELVFKMLLAAQRDKLKSLEVRWYQVVEPKRHRNKEKYPGYKLLRYVQLGHNFLRN